MLAALLVLAQIASTPTPRPAPLLGKSAPVAAGPRSLADIVKEKPKTPGTVSLAESSRVSMMTNARDVCYAMWRKNPTPPSRDMMDACVQLQQEAFVTSQLPGPSDVPKDVFAAIRSSCMTTWPNNFSLQVLCEKDKVGAYRAAQEKK